MLDRYAPACSGVLQAVVGVAVHAGLFAYALSIGVSGFVCANPLPRVGDLGPTRPSPLMIGQDKGVGQVRAGVFRGVWVFLPCHEDDYVAAAKELQPEQATFIIGRVIAIEGLDAYVFCPFMDFKPWYRVKYSQLRRAAAVDFFNAMSSDVSDDATECVRLVDPHCSGRRLPTDAVTPASVVRIINWS